eukprot:2824464-Ditylum_brightwellii.AAC.1
MGTSGTRHVLFVAAIIAALAPNTLKSVVNDCPILCVNSRSTLSISAENLFNTQPVGVTSKKDMGALRIYFVIFSCSCLDA